jgi:hypothetical protein
VKRQLQDGDDEGLQVELLLKSSSKVKPSFKSTRCSEIYFTTATSPALQSNMQHLIGTQTKLKEMQITILKLALMAQKKHEMEVDSAAALFALVVSRFPGHAGCSWSWVCSGNRVHFHGGLPLDMVFFCFLETT